MKINSDSTNSQIQLEIGRRIRIRRIDLGLSQYDLAVKTGLSLRSISNIENGKETSFKSIVMILRVLNLVSNIDFLIPEPIGFDINKSVLLSDKKRHRKRKKDDSLFVWGEK